MIPLPSLPKIIEKKKNMAVIEIKPLYPGYGVTMGNSYRRVLLSSLEGAAITQVKIEGASHEFSSIPGILEDVLIILLNLKKIRFKNWSEEPQNVFLQVKNEKEVKAKDFKLNPQIEIANPDAHIATLTDKKAELQLEAKIEKGVGYCPAEEMEGEKTEIGVILIDAIFTPVRKVNFEIENVRVGKKTDFEKLNLKIETDGTISPEEAFSRATDILINHFSLFKKFEKKTTFPKKETTIKEEGKVKTKKKKVEKKKPLKKKPLKKKPLKKKPLKKSKK